MENYCLDCGKDITRNSKRCGHCAQVGKNLSEETKKKMLGRISWNKGLVGCNSPSAGFQKGNKLTGMTGKKHSQDTKIKISCTWQSISPNEWNGFKQSYLKRLRTSSKWKIWRELVFFRDNFTCQNINCEFCDNKIGVVLHPHHIKPISLYQELAFNINNGITDCEGFHINSGLHKNMREKQNRVVS